MRKYHLLIGSGMVLAVLSVPMLFGFTLFDQRTVSTFDMDERSSEDGMVEMTYTFEDIGPGMISIKARGFLSTEPLHVRVTRGEDGPVIDDYEMEPKTLTWSRRETAIEYSGDMLVSITMSEEQRWLVQLNVRYTSRYSSIGLLSAVLGFPAFLIAGAAGIIWGTVKLRGKKKKPGEEAEAPRDSGYEEELARYRLKREEYDSYETSPRRRELWFEPLPNPYDDVPPDHYEKKREEGLAFGRKWHQRLGEGMWGKKGKGPRDGDV